GRPSDHALQLPRPHGRQHGRGVPRPCRTQPQFLRHQGKLRRHQPCPPAGTRLSPCADVVRHGRPGARILRMGCPQLGMRGFEFPAGRTYRALPGLRGRGRFQQGPADHVRDDAAHARSRAGRQVHPVHQAWLRDGRLAGRSAEVAAEAAEQGRHAPARTGGSGSQAHECGNPGGGMTMGDLLTHEEYAAIAAGLQFPTQAFVDGGFRPALSGKTFDTINPATGKVLAKVASCGPEDVDFAVQKARDAFEDGRWSRLHPSERKEILIRLTKLMKRNARELAVLESLDSGKTIYDCEHVDVPETIHCIKWHAELIDKIYDQVSPASDNHIAMIVREPVGVVGLVLPWNFPLLMLAWKIGPALAAGNSVIVKPAKETTLRSEERRVGKGGRPGW